MDEHLEGNDTGPLEMHLRPPAWIAALLNALCNT